MRMMGSGTASRRRAWRRSSLRLRRMASLTQVRSQLTFNIFLFTLPSSLKLGNASQVSDGAAAVVLARRSTANRLNLPILGKFVTAATIGVPPRIMGVGPAYAIPRVLHLTGLVLDEINEALASQSLFSIDHLKIPHENVNLNGGRLPLGIRWVVVRILFFLFMSLDG